MAQATETGGAPSRGGVPWRAIVLCVLGVEALGLAVGAAFGPEAGGWYEALEKPALTPPGWAFPVAWTLLYGMMGVAAALVWSAPSSAVRRGALVAFAAQLALNLSWSPVFFGAQALTAAVFVTAAIVAAALLAAVLMARVDRRAGWLMAPYVAWVGFAFYLTASIWSLNG